MSVSEEPYFFFFLVSFTIMKKLAKGLDLMKFFSSDTVWLLEFTSFFCVGTFCMNLSRIGYPYTTS